MVTRVGSSFSCPCHDPVGQPAPSCWTCRALHFLWEHTVNKQPVYKHEKFDKVKKSWDVMEMLYNCRIYLESCLRVAVESL